MDLGSLLPPASVADMVAKRVRVRLDDVEYALPVLSIREQRAWEERLDGELVWLLDTVREDGDDVGAVLRALSESPGRFIDLLLSYDHSGLLPDRDTIETVETEMGLLLAVLEVWRAGRPLVGIGIETFAESARPMTALPRLTSSLPPPTAGPTTTSRTN